MLPSKILAALSSTNLLFSRSVAVWKERATTAWSPAGAHLIPPTKTNKSNQPGPHKKAKSSRAGG
eukprot:3267531-Rhodomonas_salina.1